VHREELADLGMRALLGCVVVNVEHDVTDELADALALLLAESSRGRGSGAHTDATRHEGGALLAGNRVLVDGDADLIERKLDVAPRDVTRRGEVDEEQVVVGAAGHEAQDRETPGRDRWPWH